MDDRAPGSMFAPPRDPISSSVERHRIRWFVRTRALRLAVAMIVWGFWLDLLAPGIPALGRGWMPTLLGALLGMLLWAPSSGILFRVVFFPGEPDPRVQDSEGNAIVPNDHRWLHRVLVWEHLLGTLPLPLFLIWLLLSVGGVAQLVGIGILLPLGGSMAWQQLKAIRSLLMSEATLDLAQGRAAAAVRRLEWLVRLPVKTPDTGLKLLAAAHHHLGHPDRAIAALDRIADPDRHDVARLKAQLEE